MEKTPLTRAEVIQFSQTLPGFPRIVSDILATLDDPESSTERLVGHIAHDPVIAARVLSLANAAANRTGRSGAVRDLYTAASLIGTNRVREMTLSSSISGFVNEIGAGGLSASFWQHSVATSICCEEMAFSGTHNVPATTAMIAGLLHDVGQLWLHRYAPELYRKIWQEALDDAVGICEIERKHFAVDHTIIGAWLTEHWNLPANITAAVRHHHTPDAALDEPLVPLLHIAETLANALDLAGRAENRVTHLSSAACRALGLTWTQESHQLFGRMEARTKYANTIG